MLSTQSGQSIPCVDKDTRCAAWADNGECEKNPSYMLSNCQQSCNSCSLDDASVPVGPLDAKVEDTSGGTRVAVHVPETSWYDRWGEGLIYGLWSFLPYTIMTLIIAFIWLKLDGRLEPNAERRNKGDDFAYGLCALDHCFHDHMWVCICSFCCTAIRMADTYSKSTDEYSVPRAIIPGFWKALCVTLAMQFLVTLTGGVGIILFVCIAVYFRQKLRQTYNLPNCTGKILAWDCLFWCCCPWCTIAQECRQVQFVTGQPVKHVSTTSFQRGL